MASPPPSTAPGILNQSFGMRSRNRLKTKSLTPPPGERYRLPMILISSHATESRLRTRSSCRFDRTLHRMFDRVLYRMFDGMPCAASWRD